MSGQPVSRGGYSAFPGQTAGTIDPNGEAVQGSIDLQLYVATDLTGTIAGGGAPVVAEIASPGSRPRPPSLLQLARRSP